ncbi:MAG: hypothetical protein ABJE66_34920 [Deltaproteobacteria bacterium]
MSDFANFAVGLVMVGSAAIGASRKILERRRARKELRSRPVLGAETDEGAVVRVTGIVRATDETIVAPISGRRCVVYRSRVTSAGGLVRRAFKARESLVMVPFVLERDGDTMPVAIEGRHALLDLPNTKLPPPRTSDERERRVSFLALHGLKASAGGIFEEVLIEPGMRVTIAGLMMKDIVAAPPEGEAGYREEAPASLRLAGDVGHPLVIGAAD